MLASRATDYSRATDLPYHVVTWSRGRFLLAYLLLTNLLTTLETVLFWPSGSPILGPT